MLRRWLLNLYAYVWNDPYNWTDPSRLMVSIDRTVLTGSLIGAGITCYGSGACQNAGQAIADATPRPRSDGLFGALFGLANAIADAMGNVLNSDSDPDPDDHGDLTDEEKEQIQNVVDEVGRPIDVVGSAVDGERRNPGSDLPIGKGENEKSDIDYTTAGSNVDEFIEFEGSLPDIDGGVLSGTPDAGTDSIRFEPGGSGPTRVRN